MVARFRLTLGRRHRLLLPTAASDGAISPGRLPCRSRWSRSACSAATT